MVLGLGVCSLGAQEYEGRSLVRAAVVADTTAVVPGTAFRVGVVLEMAEGWHTYWKFPGDAGLPTEVEWGLPEGFVVGPLEWPTPVRIIEPGDIHVYGYKGKVMLVSEVMPPAALQSSEVEITADLTWLVCEAICIPGSASVSLTLPVQSEALEANAPLFAAFDESLPLDSPPPFDLNWSYTAGVLELSGLPKGVALDLFPLPEEGGQPGHAEANPEQGAISLATELPFQGLLVVGTGSDRKVWPVAWQEPQGDQMPVTSRLSSPTVPSTSLLQALIYGFLGGLILNLMPCVLPVISLKIFGFIRQAGDSPAKIFRHGLAFTGGIFLWFLGLGVLVVAIKLAGGQATWAFQFQNPWFNLAISTVVFVFALNLFGVFEIVLPGRAATAISDASASHGYGGSFFQGMFATLLATPCTAPFLGTALGFAFSQSAPVILAMFGSVALGMASPYLVLSAKPGWMKRLPRPGAWMERMKQFMGFPLLATLVWLLSILGNQKGFDAVIWAACFLLSVALACWIYGAFCGPMSGLRTRAFALTTAAVVLVLGTYLFIFVLFTGSSREPSTARVERGEGIPWESFTQARLDELLAEGRGVFLDFTADWCITCKFNARSAIDRPAVRAAFQETGIIPMKADWTNSNPEITAALAKFGRVGVPFYVVYPPGGAGEPLVLPELLTESMVLEALARAAAVQPSSRQ